MGGYGSGSESDCYSDGDDHHKNANPLARSGSTNEGAFLIYFVFYFFYMMLSMILPSQSLFRFIYSHNLLSK